MNASAPAVQAPVAAPAAPVERTLDDLLALDAKTLGELYRNARVPRVDDLSGDLRGRMLAIPGMPWPLARVVRWFAGWNRFQMWRGKSFQTMAPDRGQGQNRVILDRWRWYRFATSIGRSRAGDFDALQLDYDNKDNPFYIRTVKDEVRELRPGLWLGQAYAIIRGKPRLVLYFGLERPRG